MNADRLAQIRITVFALAGLICATYSGLAIAGDTPRPFSPWLPGASGAAAGAILWISALLAGRRTAGIAHDELYRLEWGQAVRVSYWFSILLYPVFGGLLAFDMLGWSSAFAAMGTAAGAAPMLAFCVITLRG